MSSKGKNDENIEWSTHGQGDSLAACCAKSSSSDSRPVSKREEAALIPLQDMEKVATTWESHEGMRGEGYRREAAQRPQVQRRQKKPQVTSNAMAVRQLLKLHKDLAPGQSFLELRAVQPETESAGGHGVDRHHRKGTRRGQHGRRRARRLHERQIFSRPASPCDEKAHCRADVRSTRVLQDRVQGYAQGVEVSARLAAPVPISIAKALFVASVGSHRKRGREARIQAYVTCISSIITDVLETERTETTTQNGSDRSKEGGTETARF